jgi:outer membrane protein assembly factor BamD
MDFRRDRNPSLELRAALAALVVFVAVAACAPGFQPRKFRTAPDLYQASLREFQRRKWDNALQGFDLLASQLPARDTLLPRVYWYQAQAHSRKGEHLLAAQSYGRLTDAFPDDSLADRALYETGREYKALWRKPTLDSQYGETALATFRSLLDRYPDSPFAKEAAAQIAALNEMFARKDYENGEHYLRRKAYDSAIIYYRDVTRLFPGTPSARASYLRLVDAYRKINYQEDVQETCTEARKFYPDDPGIGRACNGVKTLVDSSRAPPATRVPVPPQPFL